LRCDSSEMKPACSKSDNISIRLQPCVCTYPNLTQGFSASSHYSGIYHLETSSEFLFTKFHAILTSHWIMQLSKLKYIIPTVVPLVVSDAIEKSKQSYRAFSYRNGLVRHCDVFYYPKEKVLACLEPHIETLLGGIEEATHPDKSSIQPSMVLQRFPLILGLLLTTGNMKQLPLFLKKDYGDDYWADTKFPVEKFEGVGIILHGTFRRQWRRFFTPTIKHQQELNVDEGYLVPLELGEKPQTLEYSELWTGRLLPGFHDIPGPDDKDRVVSVLVSPHPNVFSDRTIRQLLTSEHPALIQHYAKFNYPGTSVVVVEHLRGPLWNGMSNTCGNGCASSLVHLATLCSALQTLNTHGHHPYLWLRPCTILVGADGACLLDDYALDKRAQESTLQEVRGDSTAVEKEAVLLIGLILFLMFGSTRIPLFHSGMVTCIEEIKRRALMEQRDPSSPLYYTWRGKNITISSILDLAHRMMSSAPEERPIMADAVTQLNALVVSKNGRIGGMLYKTLIVHVVISLAGDNYGASCPRAPIEATPFIAW